jgi:hypothetical protein
VASTKVNLLGLLFLVIAVLGGIALMGYINPLVTAGVLACAIDFVFRKKFHVQEGAKRYWSPVLGGHLMYLPLWVIGLAFLAAFGILKAIHVL